MRETILGAGFAVVAWNDVTEGALRFLDAMVARSRNAETPRLGLHLVLGPDFPDMVSNFRRNLAEESCGADQAVFPRLPRILATEKWRERWDSNPQPAA